RLHYTTDWFVDNEQKGVVKILAPELPGAEPFTQKVGIMSQHPEHYRQLKSHPELIPAIKAAEDRINAFSLKYVPMDKLKAAEPLLVTGDIVGVATTEEGIDIAHTGLCIKDEQGVVHFMDASSSRRNMKVTLEREISACLNWSPKLTGAMFARPLEVGKV
ncbi:MAG TPA: N-acetylmuramoyl-L-alanine amidase-like domain-containing protein, partial [Verrucomicrobiae bacterium]|nr:N-acetylmuramoyl-L-alanine amidase-like domain-containing protein [Verrucomicrobiae bacterium]